MHGRAEHEIPVGYPDLRDYPPLGRRNLLNVAVTLWVAVPPVVCALVLFRWFPAGSLPADPGLAWPSSMDEAAALLLHHPILAANLFFFLFVDIQFWVIALLQRSSWLIDPYWTLLPPLLAFFYLGHPLAQPDGTRALISTSILLVWFLRLTFNYFRRERWRFGYREDWRYAKMRAERRHFWLEQFFIVHLVQHLLLVGLTLPFWAIAFRDVALGPGDLLLLGLASVGIAIARSADVQLDAFMRANEGRRARQEPRIPVLDRGIWRTSRHPNYFGEQLFWWSVAGFGAICGEPWVVVGTAFNSIVLAGVTVMTERRMRAIPERREAFEAYCSRTSVWIPWWPRRASERTVSRSAPTS
jgi:steroid 5-alpha reductase family enzyme